MVKYRNACTLICLMLIVLVIPLNNAQGKNLIYDSTFNEKQGGGSNMSFKTPSEYVDINAALSLRDFERTVRKLLKWYTLGRSEEVKAFITGAALSGNLELASNILIKFIEEGHLTLATDVLIELSQDGKEDVAAQVLEVILEGNKETGLDILDAVAVKDINFAVYLSSCVGNLPQDVKTAGHIIARLDVETAAALLNAIDPARAAEILLEASYVDGVDPLYFNGVQKVIAVFSAMDPNVAVDVLKALGEQENGEAIVNYILENTNYAY